MYNPTGDQFSNLDFYTNSDSNTYPYGCYDNSMRKSIDDQRHNRPQFDQLPYNEPHNESHYQQHHQQQYKSLPEVALRDQMRPVDTILTTVEPINQQPILLNEAFTADNLNIIIDQTHLLYFMFFIIIVVMCAILKQLYSINVALSTFTSMKIKLKK